MHAVFRSARTCAAVVVLVAASVSCGDVIRQGRAPVQIVIDDIQAASGAEPDELGGFLLSDVQTLVNQNVNGQTVRVATIFNDLGSASMHIIMKDQGTGGLGTSPSPQNAVQLDRYRIVYRRADGRNTPGVDVPFPIEGAATATLCHCQSISTISFEIVRHQAKLEQPLRSLAGFGGRMFISTIAEITFFGHDLAGNEIQATGQISVSFSDYGDPE
jgi:hypothetical protein